MLTLLLTGVTLGTAAGLSPGPLLALLISQTLRYGWPEGIKVALAPILTDLPIIAVTLLVLSQLTDVRGLLAVVSIAGALYLAWLGQESLRVRGVEVDPAAATPHSIRKAMLVNFLNPHVYVFWITVGSPLLLKAAAPAAFVGGFYACLCGSKMLIAVLLARSSGFLSGRAYLWTIRLLGVALLGFAVWLLVQGAGYLSR